MNWPQRCDSELMISSWCPPPASVNPGKEEVHLWLADQDDPKLDPEAQILILSKSERNRAARFHFPLHRGRFIRRRVFLRCVLSSYLRRAPEALAVALDRYGKPFIRSPAPISFNLSHSGQWALLAVAAGINVGVDIEQIRHGIRTEAIARRFFSPREQQDLFRVPSPQREGAFFSAWTRKEAYVKARGVGLSIPLDQFSVTLLPGTPSALLEADTDGGSSLDWRLIDLTVKPGFAAALAVRGRVRQLKCWIWPGIRGQD